MIEDEVIERVAPIAGIPIEHHCVGALQFKPSFTGIWSGTNQREPSIVLRHEIGNVNSGMTRQVFEIPSVATYYDDGVGGITIRYHAVDPGMPVYVLRTVRAGYEYHVSYEFAPTFAIPRRDKEMNSFAISLAARGRGLLGHGAGMRLPTGKGALCLGVSGTGKSTLAHMMLDQPEVQVLNDDRLALTRESDGVHLWSTPWPGRAGIAFDGDAPLGVIALLARHDTARVRRPTTSEILHTLLATVALPVWGEHVNDGLNFIDELVKSIPIVELAYPLGPDIPKRIVELLLEVSS